MRASKPHSWSRGGTGSPGKERPGSRCNEGRRFNAGRAMHACMIAMMLCCGATGVAQQRAQGELVERTLAIVGGSAITLSDVQTAIVLGLVEGSPDVPTAAEALVKRTLMLREVERYAPPEPVAARIDARLAQLRERVAPAELTTLLAAGGFTEARLRAWVRDDLRITAYLDQRFAADGPERRQSLIEDWVTDLRRRTAVVELWKK